MERLVRNIARIFHIRTCSLDTDINYYYSRIFIPNKNQIKSSTDKSNFECSDYQFNYCNFQNYWRLDGKYVDDILFDCNRNK